MCEPRLLILVQYFVAFLSCFCLRTLIVPCFSFCMKPTILASGILPTYCLTFEKSQAYLCSALSREHVTLNAFCTTPPDLSTYTTGRA